jgi:RNA polymerase sigma-70 factor (ECF subfamily)
MSPDPTSDEGLIERFRHSAGDERREIASELFDRHYARVARWCYRFTSDRDAAADVAQNVFVKAYKHLADFQGASQFSTWLYSIARHECLARYRKERSRPLEQDEDALVDVPEPGDGPDAMAERDSNARYAHQVLLDTLDETERAVFTLHYGDDMPLEQITRTLGLANASGAKAYIVSAKRKLAKAVRRIEARGGRL